LGAVDTESYAIAATCMAFKTPFFFLKTITSLLDQPDTMLTRVRVGLEKSIEVGNLIIALLRDLDRT
jgi:nucleoside phosphorylase